MSTRMPQPTRLHAPASSRLGLWKGPRLRAGLSGMSPEYRGPATTTIRTSRTPSQPRARAPATCGPGRAILPGYRCTTHAPGRGALGNPCQTPAGPSAPRGRTTKDRSGWTRIEPAEHSRQPRPTLLGSAHGTPSRDTARTSGAADSDGTCARGPQTHGTAGTAAVTPGHGPVNYTTTETRRSE